MGGKSGCNIARVVLFDLAAAVTSVSVVQIAIIALLLSSS